MGRGGRVVGLRTMSFGSTTNLLPRVGNRVHCPAGGQSVDKELEPLPCRLAESTPYQRSPVDLVVNRLNFVRAASCNPGLSRLFVFRLLRRPRSRGVDGGEGGREKGR